MQVHPDIARLRGACASQPHTDAALAQWRATPQAAAVLEALALLDCGAALADLPQLARLLDDPAAGLAFAQALITPLCASLRAEPLAHVPLSHSSTPDAARLQLASHGRCALTLLAIAQRARTMPPSVLFEDCAAHEIVLAGAGEALLHRRHARRIVTRELACSPGTRFTCQGADAARQFIAVSRPLLLLQLTQVPACPQASCEVAVADGALLKVISGSKASGQQLMALGVLGALDHRAALGPMARLAQDSAAERDVRWEALRQCLALDASAGLAVLAALSSDPDDGLNAPATALQAQLLATRPDLAGLIAEAA